MQVEYGKEYAEREVSKAISVQQQAMAELIRRSMEKPASLVITHSEAQQIALSSLVRGTLLVGGGNQSGKSLVGIVKVASIADGYHGDVMCPRDCPMWGIGSCGLHGCPSQYSGGTNCCEAFGKAIYCDKHPPIGKKKPRKLAIVAEDYDHIYDVLYDHILKHMLRRTIGNAPTWIEPSHERGRHLVEAKDGSYTIDFISLAHGPKKQIRGHRWEFVHVDELCPRGTWRELIPRMWHYNGQIMITATHDTLMDQKIEGQWIFPDLVDVKSPGIQIVSIDTQKNRYIDQDRVAQDAERYSEEERAIRIKGGFGYRSNRCAFDSFAILRQEKTIAEPEIRYLDGCYPPTAGWMDHESYYNGPTVFPERCELDAGSRQILMVDRQQTSGGGVACSDCIKRCPYYTPPPRSKIIGQPNPSLIHKQTRDPRSLIDATQVQLWDSNPQSGHLYILGADTAKGVKGGDWSIARIFNAMTGNESCMLRAQIRERVFAYALYGLHVLFNRCYMVIEANGPGAQVIDILLNELGLEPRFLYFDTERKIVLPSGDVAPFPGFLTTQSSKRERLISKLNAMCIDGSLKMRSSIAVSEMKSFIREAGKINAMEGAHDDTVIAGGLVAVGWNMVDRTGLLESGKGRAPSRYSDEAALAVYSTEKRIDCGIDA